MNFSPSAARVGVAALAVLLACNGAVRREDANDASSPFDAGARADVSLFDPDAGVCNGGICPVAVKSMDVAEVNPPRADTQGSCTYLELAKVQGSFATIVASVSPTCASCIFTEASDTTNTQFFVWADAMHVNVSLENFGACMGSPLSGGNADCGKAAEEVQSCLDAACPHDAMGASICGCITPQDCISAALQFDCKTYDDRQTAACGGSTQLQAIKSRCFDSTGGIGPGLQLLCGGTPIKDAGGG